MSTASGSKPTFTRASAHEILRQLPHLDLPAGLRTQIVDTSRRRGSDISSISKGQNSKPCSLSYFEITQYIIFSRKSRSWLQRTTIRTTMGDSLFNRLLGDRYLCLSSLSTSPLLSLTCPLVLFTTFFNRLLCISLILYSLTSTPRFDLE